MSIQLEYPLFSPTPSTNDIHKGGHGPNFLFASWPNTVMVISSAQSSKSSLMQFKN